MVVKSNKNFMHAMLYSCAQNLPCTVIDYVASNTSQDTPECTPYYSGNYESRVYSFLPFHLCTKREFSVLWVLGTPAHAELT